MNQHQPLAADDPRRLGPYEVVARLGEGGQGVVYLGRAQSGEQVAVKLLHHALVADAEARLRFLREVAVAQRVARFCTAPVLHADLDGSRPYIVSEYVPGPSLREMVINEGPRRGAALERLAISTATALAAIHRAGILHRDFKPANVLMGPEGPVVIDFGIARALDSPGATATGMAMGTPSYLAPEQLSGAVVSEAADVFAWGVTMVFAATGKPAFGSDSIPVVMNRILHDEPELGQLEGVLGELVAACLSKDPSQRPGADELIMRLTGQPVPPAVDPVTGGQPAVSGGFPPAGRPGAFPQPGAPMPDMSPMAAAGGPQPGMPGAPNGPGMPGGPNGPGMAGGQNGPGVAGGQNGPGMAGGPNGPGMPGGQNGPGMPGGPNGPGMAGGQNGPGMPGGAMPYGAANMPGRGGPQPYGMGGPQGPGAPNGPQGPGPNGPNAGGPNGPQAAAASAVRQRRTLTFALSGAAAAALLVVGGAVVVNATGGGITKVMTVDSASTATPSDVYAAGQPADPPIEATDAPQVPPNFLPEATATPEDPSAGLDPLAQVPVPVASNPLASQAVTQPAKTKQSVRPTPSTATHRGGQPTRKPTTKPTQQPSHKPTTTSKPTSRPSTKPTPKPTSAPTTKPPTTKPSTKPTTAKPSTPPATKPPTTKPNPYTPTAACGAGYKVIDSHALGSSATIYLLYASGKNCVVTMSKLMYPGKMSMNATLAVQKGSSGSNPGSFTAYAGPVRIAAASKCVMWGGSWGTSSWKSGWTHCG